MCLDARDRRILFLRHATANDRDPKLECRVFTLDFRNGACSRAYRFFRCSLSGFVLALPSFSVAVFPMRCAELWL